MNCKPGEPPSPGKVCRLELSEFQNCSSERNYGFDQSRPCIFLKLNRIFNWVPEYYNDPTDLPEEMPEKLKKHIESLKPELRNQVWVSCSAEHPSDREAIPVDNFDYFPSPGLGGEFYPYTNSPGYLSPLVAVQLTHPQGERERR